LNWKIFEMRKKYGKIDSGSRMEAEWKWNGSGSGNRKVDKLDTPLLTNSSLNIPMS
jgi:hypothetical protein